MAITDPAAASLPPSRSVSVTLTPLMLRYVVLTLTLLVVALLYGIAGDFLRLVEERVGNYGWVLQADNSIENRVVVVAVDEKSLSEVGPWPWPRDVLAQLAQRIKAAGASQQLYDLVLPEAREGDQLLREALLNSSAVLAQVPVLHSELGVQTGLMTNSVTGVRCRSPLPMASDFVASHANFADVPKGHITPVMDEDGFIRHVPALICVDGRPYPALALSAMLHGMQGANHRMALTQGQSWFDPAYWLSIPDYPGFTVPLDSNGMMRVSYRDHPSAYQVISAADLLRGDIGADALSGAWVLVGATAFGLGDIVPTPYAGVVPGVEIQARLLTALLDNQTPYTPRLQVWAMVLLVVVVTAIMIGVASLKGRAAAVGLLAVGLLFPLLCLCLHQVMLGQGLWFGWVYPSLYALVGGAGLSLVEHTRARDERKRVFDNLNSYLPSGVAGEIAFNLPAGVVEASRQELVIMCADLRNFSAFEEFRPPEESAALLHRFFTLAGEVISRHGGSVHEYKGDAFLAVWPAGQGEGVRAALKAATELVETVEQQVLADTSLQGLEPLALGVGIEMGSALVGSIGPVQRRTHTLLGQTVTIALRVQEMTVELAQPILLGEKAAGVLPEAALESQGDYLLPGLRIPHTLYAPVPQEGDGGEPPFGQVLHLQLVRGGLVS